MNVTRDKWCRHRTPFTSEHKTCKIGVDFHQFPKPHNVMPCLGETAEARAGCPKYSGYTPEEIKLHDDEWRGRLTRIGTIRQAVVANIKTTGQRAGRIPCPACGKGTVSYSQASNGHVHARCSTEGCASWME